MGRADCQTWLRQAYDQSLARHLNYLLGNSVKRIDLHDALDFGEQPLDDLEIATSDADNGGDSFDIF